MPSHPHTVLKNLLEKYNNSPAIKSLQNKLNSNNEDVVAIYKEFIPLIENEIWKEGPDTPQLDNYYNLFQELESHISSQANDDRYQFMIVVPVADRPKHLESCMNSLLELCRRFNYGGHANNKFNKVSVIIADDSKHIKNIERNKEIARQFSLQGIETEYFGLEQQIIQIDQPGKTNVEELSAVLGNTDRTAFYHKGPSLMRNITYLKLNEISKDNGKILFYFMDSDQEFRIKINTAHPTHDDEDLYAINYFYHLDRIFSETNTCILTGKVVGDPPVSPAVMAGNFLADVICFLQKMAALNPDAPCQFHNRNPLKANDAAYHDMANLFGFNPAKEPYQYQCTLCGEHDNANCLVNFSEIISNFFYGEHPTRKTYYQHQNVRNSLAEARTLYTGNYIFKPEAIKYFIPFATLKLRMAGPVLGRIIKSEIPERFVSANLPMLHKRTVDDTGKSEFRPGIDSENQKVDLSGEFERQYFGDVMLFTIDKLTDAGYPNKELAKEFIVETLMSTEKEIHKQYQAKHAEIKSKLEILRKLISNQDNWWNKHVELESANQALSRFAGNIEHNYGNDSVCYQLINSGGHKTRRLNEMAESIFHYVKDRQRWENLLG